MLKLSDYTQEEIDAVMEHFDISDPWVFGLTDDDQLRMLNSLNGSLIVLRVRLKRIGREILKMFAGKK